MIFKLGELFCGPGGIAMGAKLANVPGYNFEHEWATDYDKDTCETYKTNLNPKTIYHEDIRKFNIEKLSPIDALAFGFPCNDFSVIGKKKGMDGVFGPLYSYGVNILKKFQPKFFLAENVGGLRGDDDGKSLSLILTELEDSGYKVTPHFYKFEYYGVPQARHRIIIIGIRNDQKIDFKVPSMTTLKPITSRSAIEEPPIPLNAPNQELTKQSEKVVLRLKHIKPGENAFNANLPGELKLNISGAKISQIYKRLDPDKPAYTITGSGGGGTHVYHWKEDRALTNRERARLQTFPDDFVFCGSKESVRKQIGMAVPPKAAKAILEAVLKSFAGIEYDSIPSNLHLKPLLGLAS